MKKVRILIVICFIVSMIASSCGSSKPCPAYRSVSSVEQPAAMPVPTS